MLRLSLLLLWMIWHAILLVSAGLMLAISVLIHLSLTHAYSRILWRHAARSSILWHMMRIILVALLKIGIWWCTHVAHSAHRTWSTVSMVHWRRLIVIHSSIGSHMLWHMVSLSWHASILVMLLSILLLPTSHWWCSILHTWLMSTVHLILSKATLRLVSIHWRCRILLISVSLTSIIHFYWPPANYLSRHLLKSAFTLFFVLKFDKTVTFAFSRNGITDYFGFINRRKMHFKLLK